MDEPPQPTAKAMELRAFLLLAVLMAPVLAVIIVAGFGFLAYVLYCMERAAWELGLAWLALGLLYHAVSMRKVRAPRSANAEAA